MGIKENAENKMVFIAMCLQSSNLNGHPHEVLITKITNEGEIKVSGSCSCKAGTGKCKHVVENDKRKRNRVSPYKIN